MRPLHFLSKALLAVACLALSVQTAMADYKQEYKMSVVPGPSSGWAQTAFYFADLVRDKTESRVNIKVYPAGQLFAGKQTSEFLMVRNGSIDFALASPINWSPQVKELNLTSLPFFIGAQKDIYKAMDAILAGKSGKMLQAAIEKKGVHFIGWAENGFRELTTGKTCVTSPADLKGLKIRVVGSPIFIETFRALGANPVNMNWGEAITGFQQGLVDGQENPVNGISLSVKIWQYHKHLCNWHYLIDPLILSCNAKVWKDISEKDQKIIEECAKLAEAYGKALSRVGFDDGKSLAYLKSLGKAPAITDARAFLSEKGMTVTELSPEQTKAFVEATQSVREAWTKKIGAELVKAAEEDMASAK